MAPNVGHESRNQIKSRKQSRNRSLDKSKKQSRANMTFLKTVLIIISASLVSKCISEQNLYNQCDMSKCWNPARITITPKDPFIWNIDSTKAIVTEYKETLEIIVTRRYRYKAYCYWGGDLDSNSGCDKSLYEVNITKRQSEEYVLGDKCMVGTECPIDGWCWESSASVCLTNSLTVDKGPKRINYEGLEWQKFAYHTCTTSWECNIYEITSPIHLAFIQRILYKYFVTKDNEIVYLNNNFFKEGYKSESSGYRYYPKENKIQSHESKIETKRYSSSLNNIKCTFPSDYSDDVAFSLDSSSLTDIYRTRFIQIECPIKVVSGKLFLLWMT